MLSAASAHDAAAATEVFAATAAAGCGSFVIFWSSATAMAHSAPGTPPLCMLQWSVLLHSDSHSCWLRMPSAPSAPSSQTCALILLLVAAAAWTHTSCQHVVVGVNEVNCCCIFVRIYVRMCLYVYVGVCVSVYVHVCVWEEERESVGACMRVCVCLCVPRKQNWELCNVCACVCVRV